MLMKMGGAAVPLQTLQMLTQRIFMPPAPTDFVRVQLLQRPDPNQGPGGKDGDKRAAISKGPLHCFACRYAAQRLPHACMSPPFADGLGCPAVCSTASSLLFLNLSCGWTLVCAADPLETGGSWVYAAEGEKHWIFFPPAYLMGEDPAFV